MVWLGIYGGGWNSFRSGSAKFPKPIDYDQWSVVFRLWSFHGKTDQKGSKELGSWRMLRNSAFPSLWVQHGRVGRVVFREVYAHP